jgi:hypothetical protein
MRKDKAKVIDEVWTEERVREFLHVLPPSGVHADYHRLLRAYRSMRDSDFKLFLGFFKKAKGDLNAAAPDGKTILDIVSNHRNSASYAKALIAAGAKHSTA